jgi:hypothetical protein
MKPQPQISTVADLQRELKQLRTRVAQLEPEAPQSGADWIKSRTTSAQQSWKDANDADRNEKREAGMRRAAELLSEKGGTYPHDGRGTRALADHAGLSLEDARSVFSAHLKEMDTKRAKHEDVEKTHLLGRAKQFAPSFTRSAIRDGIDVAAQKLATKAQVSLSIAREALEDHANSLDEGQ